jgi:hypothetical protein
MHVDLGMFVDLADAAERLGEDPLFRFELLVEAQRGPVAAAAFVRDRAGRGAAPRAGGEELDELPIRESLLHLEQPHHGAVAGENVDGEDGKPIDARECRAACDELGRLDG